MAETMVNVTMDNILDLLCNPNSSAYHFRKGDNGDYIVENERSNLVAIIDMKTGIVEYCVTGVYNSGDDWATIDIEELNSLKMLCDRLVDLYKIDL